GKLRVNRYSFILINESDLMETPLAWYFKDIETKGTLDELRARGYDGNEAMAQILGLVDGEKDLMAFTLSDIGTFDEISELRRRDDLCYLDDFMICLFLDGKEHGAVACGMQDYRAIEVDNAIEKILPYKLVALWKHLGDKMWLEAREIPKAVGVLEELVSRIKMLDKGKMRENEREDYEDLEDIASMAVDCMKKVIDAGYADRMLLWFR
ncbi:MAG: hypothetical protein ACFFCS_29040, partial [Candidatus Hodarchaeota archaeon]